MDLQEFPPWIPSLKLTSSESESSSDESSSELLDALLFFAETALGPFFKVVAALEAGFWKNWEIRTV